MLGAGMVGAGALRLIPGLRANGPADAGWLHAALHTADSTQAHGKSLDFTLEAWIRVPGRSLGAANVTCSGRCECLPSSGTTHGTISDGPSNYGNKAVCRWLISSDVPLHLRFSSFDTESDYDLVYVNECIDASCSTKTQLAQLSGNLISNLISTFYFSSTGYLEVELTSDWSDTRSGFVASWSTQKTVRLQSFVLASTDYAVALREFQDGAGAASLFRPLFFWTSAPQQQCVAGPLVLTDSTGAIGDGPGLLARYEGEGPQSCSWILAPGGSGGGYQDVTLFFTQFLLTSRDSLALASCWDINCKSASEPVIYTGASVPPRFVSSTPVMLVNLTKYSGAQSSSAGFIASYAGTPAVTAAFPGLAASVWHHVAVSVSTSGRLSLIINGTQWLTQQLPWDPAPTQNPLTHGAHATAIGHGAPAWQDGGAQAWMRFQDGEFSQVHVDELRFWTKARTVSDIAAAMHLGCQALAAAATGHTLAACYSFDAAEKVDVAGVVDPFFLDSSRNGIRAFAAAHSSPHLPWCVNMDDDGVLKLDENVNFDWSNNEMWGYCSSKVRLPGVGFDYSETTMEQAAVHRLSSTAAVLEHYPGCGDIPLR